MDRRFDLESTCSAALPENAITSGQCLGNSFPNTGYQQADFSRQMFGRQMRVSHETIRSPRWPNNLSESGICPPVAVFGEPNVGSALEP
jgi:hypothetical protein